MKYIEYNQTFPLGRSCYIFICEHTIQIPYPNISGWTASPLTDWLLCKYSCVTHFCECSVGVVLNSAGKLNPKRAFLGALCARAFIVKLISALICWHIRVLWVLLQHLNDTLQPAAEQSTLKSERCLCLGFGMCAYERTTVHAIKLNLDF